MKDFEAPSEKEWDNICKWQQQSQRELTYQQWRRFNDAQPKGEKVTLSEFVEIIRDSQG